MGSRTDTAAVRRATAPDSILALIEGNERELSSVDAEGAAALMHEHGAVLFRGFRVAAEDFVTFSARFCGQFLEHGSLEFRPRRSGDGTVAQVLIGNDSVALHAEMNYSPLRPDVLWFHCTQPAAKGGETLLADSRAVLRELSPQTRQAFETRKLRYRHVLTPETWHHTTKLTDREQAITLLNFVPGVSATPVEPDSIQFDFETEAIRPTGRTGEPGFLNSVENIVEYRDMAPTRVTFSDGEPISEALLADIGRASHSCALPIEWQPHDVVMIDNGRLMHGRAAFQGDSPRIIDVRFGMLRPEFK